MSYKKFNESFKETYNKILTEAFEDKTLSFADELRKVLNEEALRLGMRQETNIKVYEHAFQDVIERLVPDKAWWEVTDLNIFWDLFENKDISGCIDRIIDNLKPEFKDEE